MAQRRTILQILSSIFPLSLLSGASACAQEESPAENTPGRDYYQELGVKPFINAAGAYSALGGARMRPQVADAMRYAATRKVKMKELHDAG